MTSSTQKPTSSHNSQPGGHAKLLKSGQLIGAKGPLSDVDFDPNFLKNLNSQFQHTYQAIDYANELYLYFLIPFHKKTKLYTTNNIKQLSIVGAKKDFLLSLATALKASVAVPATYRALAILTSIIQIIISATITLSSACLLSIFLLLRFITKPNNHISGKISVIRTFAAYKKTKFLETEGWTLLSAESFMHENLHGSIYRSQKRRQRICSIILVPLCAIRDFIQIIRDSYKLFGPYWTGSVALYFSTRITQKCIFEYYLETILGNTSITEYVTSNKEDRFAITEKRVTSRHDIPSICIPHGIEYSFAMPSGLVGNQFYCTTEEAKRSLSALYKQQEFLYDKYIAEKMFRCRHNRAHASAIYIFFTEAVDIKTNRAIISHLLNQNTPIHIKLHPKDSHENYKDLINENRVIDDFEEAICDNICIARKSTILVEALYNNSTAVSIMITKQDKGFVHHMLPSLMDDSIHRVYSLDELTKALKVLTLK